MRTSLGFRNSSFTTPRLSVSQNLFIDFVISSGFKSIVITFVILFVVRGARVAHALVVTFENFLSLMGPDKIDPSLQAIATDPKLVLITPTPPPPP